MKILSKSGKNSATCLHWEAIQTVKQGPSVASKLKHLFSLMKINSVSLMVRTFLQAIAICVECEGLPKTYDAITTKEKVNRNYGLMVTGSSAYYSSINNTSARTISDLVKQIQDMRYMMADTWTYSQHRNVLPLKHLSQMRVIVVISKQERKRNPPRKLFVHLPKRNIWFLLKQTSSGLSIADWLKLDKEAYGDVRDGLRYIHGRRSKVVNSMEVANVDGNDASVSVMDSGADTGDTVDDT
ncbi:unnamed protein product [Absidia cylindrospora]